MTLTIGILSWGSDKTLLKTLESYAYHRLDRSVDEKIVFLQEATKEQESMCGAFGYRTISSAVNIGIARAYSILVQESTSDHFLFLENDWRMIEPPYPQITFGENLLLSGEADIVRLRHRENPGSPLWTRQFQGHEYDRPTHLLDSIHWTDPSKFPEIHTRRFDYFSYDFSMDSEQMSPVEKKTSTWYITSSKYANWTNNPHMAKKQFLLDNVLPHLRGGNLEADLQNWWQQQNFLVAQSDGLFTHDRID